MKREYEKPSVKVEQYESDVCVAASYCNEPTQIICLVGGQKEWVFSSGQEGCTGTGVTKVYYGGYYYYIWYTGTRDNFDGTDTDYTKILKALGYDTGYHIATVVTEYSAITSG